VQFTATAISAYPITKFVVYANKQNVYQANSSTLNASVALRSGTYSIFVRAWDSSGAYGTSPSFWISVVQSATTAVQVTVQSPAAGATLSSPLQFTATASSSNPITGFVVYANNQNVYQTNGSTLNASVALPDGTYSVLIGAWDSSGAYGTSPAFPITVGTPAHGINYYVSPMGSDTNNGSAAAPFRTIQHAANLVNPGDTVHVLPGTYAEAINLTRGGSAAARIRFISDSKWAAKITGDGTINDAFMVRDVDYVDIVGFEVTNTTGYEGIELMGSYGRALGNLVHHVWAHGCTDWRGGAGVNSSNYNGTGNEIIGNIVHDVGDYSHGCASVHGIYIANSHNVVQNNIAYRNQGWGITSWHYATNNIITNNTVFNNATAGINTGNENTGDNGTVVANNIVVFNGIATNWVCYPSGSLSTACADPRYGIGQEGNNGSSDQYLNNLVYGNVPADIHVSSGTVSGNLTANPSSIFVNYAGDGSGDYHLSSGSPAIDTGVTLDAPTRDIDGGTRPINRAYDIGAYEYGSTPATWCWY
jgi:hypothetical protein